MPVGRARACLNARMSDAWSTPDPSASQPDPFGAQAYEPQPYTGGPATPVIAYAGFWIRFAGGLIDGIILSLANVVLRAVTGDVLGSLLGMALSLGYFTYLHSTKAGQTLGQKAVGIRIADAATGGQVEPGNAAIRWLVSILSGVAIFLGYLWMLWDPRKQTWHDKAASTVVVKADAHPAPTNSLLDR